MDEVVITAPFVSCEQGTCTATGPVTLDTPTLALTAASAVITQSDAGQVLVLGAGQLIRPEPLAFEGATVTLPAGSTSPTVSGLRVIWEPCVCDDGGPTMLTLSAREATVTASTLRVTGGALRVFTIPLIPLPPLRIALDPDRLRLLVPEIGYGDSGLSARAGAQWGWEDWRYTAGAGLRQANGAWAFAETIGPTPGEDLGGSAQAAGGWDWQTASLRGAVASRAGTHGPLRAAWDLGWQSDPDWASDYGGDWVSRGAPRQEQRAVMGLGPARLDLAGSSDGTGSQALLRVRQAWGGPRAEAGVWAAGGGAGLTWEDLAPVAIAGMDTRFAWSGPVAVGTAAGAQAQLSGEGLMVESQAQVSAEVPMWTGKLQLWPGVTGTGHTEQAGMWGFVGAGSRAELRLQGWALAGSAHLGSDEAGLTGRISLDANGPVRVSLRLGRRQQSGELGWTYGRWSGSLGSARRDDQWVAWAGVDGRLGRLRVGLGGTSAIDAAQAWTGRALVGYDDGCTLLAVTGALSPDRALPDLGVKLEVRR